MDETAAAYLHERELPYFTMFGQGSRPYKDLEGEPRSGGAGLAIPAPISNLPVHAEEQNILLVSCL